MKFSRINMAFFLVAFFTIIFSCQKEEGSESNLDELLESTLIKASDTGEMEHFILPSGDDYADIAPRGQVLLWVHTFAVF